MNKCITVNVTLDVAKVIWALNSLITTIAIIFHYI